ncbi:hypothetical protein I4F81_000042 [Pyropia yezoensis]|uniref:Uncharacterized protein n=1 Tax=Pyropia yezoensis TaxID=2788 RepID=A0ACC3BI26_PYRYE|nr:hypothetical protein I4F81_000042 [Neopyropia yezoensis]
MPVDGNQRSEGSPLSDEVVAWVDMDAAGGTGGTASAGAELLVAGRRRLAQAKSSADSGSGSPQPMNDDTRRGRREVDLDGAGAEGIFNAGSAEVRSGIEIGYKHQRPPTLAQLCLNTDTSTGYPVAGSSAPITVLTLEDYSSALVLLFGEALLEGTSGGVKIVPDCERRNSEWKRKGVAEKTEEAKIRQDPGTMMGNPMHTDVVKKYKSAAEKDARINGEQSVTSAPVTMAMMRRLYATLVMAYLPGPGATASSTLGTGIDGAAASESAAHVRTPVPSFLPRFDFILYCLYAFAWTTLARPLSLISMKHRDVSLPDFGLPRNQEFMNIHGHHRFINVKVRVTKRGDKTSDVLVLRIFSCFAEVSDEEQEELGQPSVIRCSAQHVNLPSLYQGLISLAMEHPLVSMDPLVLADTPLFTFTTVRTRRGAVSAIKPMSENEIHSRFAANSARIGESRVNGQRPCRMYGFRRGGAQDLLDRTGKYELVMRLGDWRANSDSFLVYLTNMHARGTLRSTLRSYCVDEVTQTVAQVMNAHTRWMISNLKDLRSMVAASEGPSHREIAEFERKSVDVLARILCELTLVLRNGAGAADDDDKRQ